MLSYSDENLNQSVSYFEKTYIGNICGGQEQNKEPTYSINEWIFVEIIKAQQPKTTNHIEGWHRSLNKQCFVSHPSLPVLLEILKSIEEVDRIKISPILNGRFGYVSKDYKKEDVLRNLVLNHTFFGDLILIDSLF